MGSWGENSFVVSADAEQAKQTGGMLAAYPAPEFAAMLAIPGGEPIEDLHVTLCYYGEDVSALGDTSQMVSALQDEFINIPGPIEAEAWAWALFNPTHPEFDPCAVYLIGRTPAFTELHDYAIDVGEVYLGDLFHKQHEPYVPHITGIYNPRNGVASLGYSGPVVFDRIALEWAGETINFPL